MAVVLRRAACLSLVAAAFVAAALVAAADGDATRPLALRTPQLLVPEATAGTGIAPEAAVRLAIDERGVVTGVEVLSIQPPSEYDDLFRQRLVETLAQWRFAPATRDGEPQASTLEWRVRFPAKPPAEAPTADGELPGGDATRRRSAILALPLEHRRRMLESESQIALRSMDAQRVHQVRTARFVVTSDTDDRRVTQAVAENFEAIFNVLAGELLPGVALQPEPYKLHIFFYQSRAGFEAFRVQMTQYEWSMGFYSPAGLIAFHREQPTSDMLVSALLHEATHAFLDRHLVRPGVCFPRWLDEGFAEYVGNSQIVDGRLRPGKALVRKLMLVQGQLVDMRTAASFDLDAAKRALRAGKGLSVGDLLAASPDTFYGPNMPLYYASSWLLVHYLRDGGEGWAGDRFPQLLLYLAEGYPQDAAFRALYGDPAAADAAYRRYVKTF
jgi:hypothetical protein